MKSLLLLVLLFSTRSPSCAWISSSYPNWMKQSPTITTHEQSVRDVRKDVPKAHCFGGIHRRAETKLFVKQCLTKCWDTIKENKTYAVNYTGHVGTIPIFRLHINESYQFAPTHVDRLHQLLNWTKHHQITDLWVVSHGWLTSADNAFSANYEELFSKFDTIIKSLV